MRDHDLKNEVGRIEDEIGALAATIDQIAFQAHGEGATAHAAFYDDVAAKLNSAALAMEAAYTLLLNGDGDSVEPLEDEVAA